MGRDVRRECRVARLRRVIGEYYVVRARGVLRQKCRNGGAGRGGVSVCGEEGRVCLEDEAAVLLARLGAREQGGARSVLEHLADTLTRLRGTFEIVLGADLLGHGHTLDGGQQLEQRDKRRER